MQAFSFTSIWLIVCFSWLIDQNTRFITRSVFHLISKNVLSTSHVLLCLPKSKILFRNSVSNQVCHFLNTLNSFLFSNKRVGTVQIQFGVVGAIHGRPLKMREVRWAGFPGILISVKLFVCRVLLQWSHFRFTSDIRIMPSVFCFQAWQECWLLKVMHLALGQWWERKECSYLLITELSWLFWKEIPCSGLGQR